LETVERLNCRNERSVKKMRHPKLSQRLSGLALVFLLLVGCGAHSAAPKPGVTFAGTIAMDTAKSATLTLKIADNGQMIETVSLAFTEIKCGGFSAGSTSSTVSGEYSILQGKFTIDENGIGKIIGRFSSPTKADGSIHILLSGMGSPIDCGTWNWSATGG
jgi:hypothetical protein